LRYCERRVDEWGNRHDSVNSATELYAVLQYAYPSGRPPRENWHTNPINGIES